MNILRFEKLDSIKRLVLQIFALFVLTSTQSTAHGAGIRFVPLQIPESGVSESDASKFSALSETLDVITASEDAESIFDAWRFGNGPRWKEFHHFLTDNQFTKRGDDVVALKAFSAYQKKTNRLSRALFGARNDIPLMDSFLEFYVGKKSTGETFFSIAGHNGFVLLDVEEQVGSTPEEAPLYFVRSAEIVVYGDPLVQTQRFDDYGAPVRFEERRVEPAVENFRAFSPDVLSSSSKSTFVRAVSWDSDGVATPLAEPLDAPALATTIPPVLSESFHFSQGDAIFAAVEPLRRLLELIRKDATPSRALLDQLNDGSHALFNVLSEDASRSYVGVSYRDLGSTVSVSFTNAFGTAKIVWPTYEFKPRVEWTVCGSKEYAEYCFDSDDKLKKIRVVEIPSASESYAMPRALSALDPKALKLVQETLEHSSILRIVDYDDDGSVKSDQRFLPGEKKIKLFAKSRDE